jgi:hypothetical protein
MNRIIPFVLGIFTFLLVPYSASASLGGDFSSVHDDQMKMQGTLRTTSKDSYDVHEIQAPSGVTLREYVSRSGNVFGLSWQGRAHPDLHQVLGSYYDAYVQGVQAQRATRQGHGPLLIQQPGLMIQMGGHMRSLVGKAYLPQALPAGVRPEDLQ